MYNEYFITGNSYFKTYTNVEVKIILFEIVYQIFLCATQLLITYYLVF